MPGKKHVLKQQAGDGEGSGGPVTNVNGDAPAGDANLSSAKTAAAAETGQPKITNTGDPVAGTNEAKS